MVILVFLVVKPFLPAVLASIVFSYMFYPLYKWVHKKIKNKNAAAFAVCIFVIILLLLPLFLVLNMISKEAYIGYLTSKQTLSSVQESLGKCSNEKGVCSFFKVFIDFFNDPKVKYHLGNTMERITSYVVDGVSGLLFSIPWFVLNFFIVIFVMFYLFKDGPGAFAKLRRVMPLREVYKRHLFEKLGNVTYAIVYGFLIVAVIQGILGAIGFFIFGVHSPVLWGILMALTALIPLLGTAIIWFPAAIIKLANGIILGNNGEIIGGILFILYGVVIISSLDNIIRPKIIGDKARIHPVLVLLGVIGGLKLFGFIGFVIGPLILAIFITLIEVYEKEGF